MRRRKRNEAYKNVQKRSEYVAKRRDSNQLRVTT